MVKAELTEKNAVFLSFVTGVHTRPGGFVQKRHVVKNFIIKCLFPKIAVFNYSCYMISVLYDS